MVWAQMLTEGARAGGKHGRIHGSSGSLEPFGFFPSGVVVAPREPIHRGEDAATETAVSSRGHQPFSVLVLRGCAMNAMLDIDQTG